MKWLHKFLMDQDRGADGGSSGSPAGGDAGEAGAGAAAAPQAGEGSSPAGSGADNGGTPPPAWAPVEINWKGQKVSVKTLEEASALMQQGYDYTSKTQEVARLKKELLAKHSRADHFLAELEKRGGQRQEPESDAGGEPEPQDKTAKLEQQLNQLMEREHERAWNGIYDPISKKFPDVPELDLANAFAKAVEEGDAQNTVEDLERIASELAPKYKDQRNQQLSKLLEDKESPIIKSYSEKVIDAFLSDKENAKLKAFSQKVISDYIADKTKLKNAGGDGGPAGAGGATQDKKRTIAEIAASYSRKE